MTAWSTPEPGAPEEPGTTGGRRRAKGRRRKPKTARRRALTVAAWTTAGVVALAGTGFGYVFFKLNGNISSVDINSMLGNDRPHDVANGSEDILVLGSDSRAGGNGKLGGGEDDGTARADTAMVVHLYDGRKKAAVVSIPRDTIVNRPACADGHGGSHDAAHGVMFNSAYSTGGAACAVKTVEKMSGIRMDHYVEVDFSGFQKLVDKLGGVQVTTTRSIQDTNSHLSLTAGTHTLTGEEALGLVRTRHAVGDGSDLGRIQLQQAFVKALVNQVKDVGVLGNPKQLYDLADTATQSMTTDSDLGSVPSLVSFADGLKNVSPSGMTMVTLPVRYDPLDGNRVLVEKDKSALVWKALKQDKAVPKAAKGTATGDAAGIVAASSSR